MVQFAGVIARFASSLTGGMGRMASMAGSTAARGAGTIASGASKGASGAARGASAAAGAAGRAAGSAGSGSRGGVKVASNALDSFVKSQEKMNKLNNRSNMDNIKYMNQFEQSMRRTERMMQRMSRYSMNMGGAFRTIGSVMAGIGVYNMLTANKVGSTQNTFTTAVGGMSKATREALMYTSKRFGLGDSGLFELNYRLGAIANVAQTTPGSAERQLLSSLNIDPTSLREMQGFDRISSFLSAFKLYGGNAELQNRLKELGGFDIAQLIQMSKELSDMSVYFNKQYSKIDEQDLNKLAELEKRRAEREAELEISFNKMHAAFTPLINDIETWWTNLKKATYEWLTPIGNSFQSLKDITNALKDAWKSFIEWIVQYIPDFMLPDSLKSTNLNKSNSSSSSGGKKQLNEMSKEEIEETIKKSEKETAQIMYQGALKSLSSYSNRMYDYMYIPKAITDLNNNIDKFEDKNKYSVGETIARIQEEFKKYDDYSFDEPFYNQGFTNEEIEDIKNGMFINALKNSIGGGRGTGLSDTDFVEYSYQYVTGNMSRDDIILKVYNNGADINSQPYESTSEYR